MKQQEEVTFQTLEENEDVQIGYSDNDIVIVDSIQRFAEINAALVSMNSIVICTGGKTQALMSGQPIELHKNQVAIIPQNIIVTDMMVSPDFEMKAMFLTNSILQKFLNKQIKVWNDMMYVHRLHIFSMEDDDMTYYSHFYDILHVVIKKNRENPFHLDIIQSLLRAAIFGLCGEMKQLMPENANARANALLPNNHFQRFLDLLNNTPVKHRTVEWYASELSITPKYLSSICKINSGKTANEWIREYVLEDIRYYLKQTDLTMNQIADKLGFPNPSYFGKYVKEHFGTSPAKFRQSKA